MSGTNISERSDMRFLLQGALAWAASALILLIAAALIVSRASVSASAIGYISSALSFLAALFAGARAARGRGLGNLYTGMITAAAIVTALLTIGFIIKGTEMEASGILSVVTFSFAGCLAGAVLFSGKKSRPKSSRFEPGQRKS